MGGTLKTTTSGVVALLLHMAATFTVVLRLYECKKIHETLKTRHFRADKSGVSQNIFICFIWQQVTRAT